MDSSAMKTSDHTMAPLVDYYGTNYSHLANELYRTIRREVFNYDINQSGWLTEHELRNCIRYLDHVHADSVLLDIGAGSGGPTLECVRRLGCRAIGIDIHEQGIINARMQAEREGLTSRVSFTIRDANLPLPFPAATFDVVLCLDAIIHLRDRRHTLTEWAAMLKPRGRILYTDTCVMTGALSKDEIAVRSSIGHFVFTPSGENERLLEATGFQVVHCEDVTTPMAAIAERWYAVRAKYAADLHQIEDAQTFHGQQEFFRVTAMLARERRLSRFLYVAEKPDCR